MFVELLNYTPNPEKAVAIAAKLCYSSIQISQLKEKASKSEIKEFIQKLYQSGHISPFEHVSFTFGVEGISRAASHQLVRHRIASYSQQSQRYVKHEHLEYIIPPKIKENEELKKAFISVMEQSHQIYRYLIEKKVETEDARYLLPNAITTKIIVTMNARSLLHFFELRCCHRAQWEIQNLAGEMLKQIKNIAPTIFEKAGPKCIEGIKYCPEGKLSCGEPFNI
ncbi:FAD-dependent thymidylate synthase [bacterium]|nr:FAD-dependent thymidylate synthase [bacterium]MBU1153819.1 FAD-dependent thymidylate synthase [bacterium]MBU2599588.1 FAD-dependent thymidylate synthase [bacterium]